MQFANKTIIFDNKENDAVEIINTTGHQQFSICFILDSLKKSPAFSKEKRRHSNYVCN